jgi:hypothetical protein
MTDKPSYIEPVRGHKPPSKLRETPKPVFEQVGEPEAIRAKVERRNERLTRGAKQPKQNVKERIMGAFLNQLLAFIRTWLYGRPVYKTITNDRGVVEFVVDGDGNKVMNKPLTVLGRMLQILGAFGLLSSTVLGRTLGEWFPVIENIITLIGL